MECRCLVAWAYVAESAGSPSRRDEPRAQATGQKARGRPSPEETHRSRCGLVCRPRPSSLPALKWPGYSQPPFRGFVHKAVEANTFPPNLSRTPL